MSDTSVVVNPLRMRVNDVRCDWPVLFKGEQFGGTGRYRCGIKLIVPKTHPQFAVIEAKIKLAAEAKWKDKATKMLQVAKSKDNVSWRDAELQAKAPDAYEGAWLLSANCQGGDTEAEAVKPKVLDRDAQTVTDPAKNPIYRGCYVSAVVEFYADDRFDTGVFCTLAGVQFRKDGDAFSAGVARNDEFEPATDGADADDIG